MIMATRRSTLPLAICFLLAFAGRGQAQDFANIIDAATKLGLTELLSAIDAANLTDTLSDPSLQAIVLAPTDDAFAELGSIDNVTQVLLYHVIPTDTPGASLNEDGGSVVTFLTLLGGLGPSDALTNLTFIPFANNTQYVGGLAPGALVTLNASVTAGSARVYLINSVLLPPIEPTPLTIAEAVSQQPALSALLQVAGLVPGLVGLLSDPENAVTLFAPSNAAFEALQAANNASLAGLLANPAILTRILTNHIVPVPLLAASLPNGTSTINTASTNDTDTLVITKKGLDVTVKGAGNKVPAKVTDANILGGKSVIHIINQVLLPAGTGLVGAVAAATAAPPPPVYPPRAYPPPPAPSIGLYPPVYAPRPPTYAPIYPPRPPPPTYPPRPPPPYPLVASAPPSPSLGQDGPVYPPSTYPPSTYPPSDSTPPPYPSSDPAPPTPSRDILLPPFPPGISIPGAAGMTSTSLSLLASAVAAACLLLSLMA